MPNLAEFEHPTIRVVIAEYQALVRRGTAMLLSLASDMECIGQACDGDEAVQLALLLRPDVVLMDLHMPVKGGVAATREITLAQPSIHVLALTTWDDDETAFEAVRAGAHAYLLKDASEDELLEAIRAVRRGESRLTPQLAHKVMEQFARLAAQALSETETTVLGLITEGSSNRQIAQAMSLAEGTIKSYVSGITAKLHANARIELAVVTNRERRSC